MKDLFEENAKKIRVYVAVETVLDPFEKNTSEANLTPYVIKAMITDLISSQVAYKMPGIITEKAKELMIEKKHKTLIESCNMIQISGENYYGWRDNSGKNLQLREECEYIRLYVYKRND